MLVGALVFTAGMVGTIGALVTAWAPLLFASSVLSGFAFGAAFLGAVATITSGVAPHHRAGLMASIFVVGYLAFSVPSMAAGLAIGTFGLLRTAEVYAVVVVLLALVAVAALLRARRRLARQSADDGASVREVLAA
jgi:MFS family permease